MKDERIKSLVTDGFNGINSHVIICSNASSELNGVNVKFSDNIYETKMFLMMQNNNILEIYNYEIDLYKIDDTHIKLSSYGISSHSAHPENGNNAISKLIIVLNEIYNYLTKS